MSINATSSVRPRFKDAIDALSEKIEQDKTIINTEEGTKAAFTVPLIRDVLGYDVNDPREVIPEFVADVGRKRGEKIDYAIMNGDKVRLLVECKKIGEPLSIENAAQLFRYFNNTPTRVAILANGQECKIYTSEGERQLMDERCPLTSTSSTLTISRFRTCKSYRKNHSTWNRWLMMPKIPNTSMR